MNIIHAISAIKRYGIKGIIDYFRRRHNTQKFICFLNSKTANITPKPGITVIGPLDQPRSLSKTLRDFVLLLKDAGVQHQALNIPTSDPIAESEYKSLLTPAEDFITNKFTHIVTLCQDFPIKDSRCQVHAIEFWEFEDGFKEAHPEVNWIKNLIAMSDFNRNTYKKLLPKSHVSKILYPFQFKHKALFQTEHTRRKYGIPTDSFVVFFNFDFKSSYYRKNPEGILLAFHEAFSDNDNTFLVFKTMRIKSSKTLSAKLYKLIHQLHLEQKIVIIDDYLTQEELVNLTNACDVYISLHRGEGFGIGIAEAMSLGKPVVVTDYSSTTEFCRTNHALLVPYSMVQVQPSQIDVDAYNHVTKWAEPNIHFAAKHLQKLYKDKNLRLKIGTAAQAFISDYFSIGNFKKSIETFIHDFPK